MNPDSTHPDGPFYKRVQLSDIRCCANCGEPITSQRPESVKDIGRAELNPLVREAHVVAAVVDAGHEGVLECHPAPRYGKVLPAVRHQRLYGVHLGAAPQAKATTISPSNPRCGASFPD